MLRRISSSKKPNSPLQDLLLDIPGNNNNNEPAVKKALKKPFEFKRLYVFILIFASFLLFFSMRQYLIRSSFDSTSSSLGASNHCKTSVPGKPLVQFVVIIDAGSTGSRVHVYKFNNCFESPELEDEVFEQIKPGLSSYQDAKKAALSLVKLLDIAASKIPSSMHRCTPIMVKATAGLRLLGKDKSEEILKETKLIVNKYKFKILNSKSHDNNLDDGISIMDGDLEGVYAWITVNHLLKNLNSKDEHNSVATLDLGGGSTQIVFEPKFKIDNEELKHPFKYELQLDESKYTLYQHSYLGFGLMEARKNFNMLITKEAKKDKHTYNLCLSENSQETFLNNGDLFTIKGNSTGLLKCQDSLREMFNFNHMCSHKTCSFNGIYQPNIEETFAKNEIYAFSYFYDRLQPLTSSEKIKVEEIRSIADNVCKGNTDYFSNLEGAKKEIENNPKRCFDLTFIYTLLNEGYGISNNRYIYIKKKIGDYETGWCLGAAISSLGQLKNCNIDDDNN